MTNEELLLRAIRDGRDDVVLSLLKAGVSTSCQDEEGFVAVISAMMHRQYEIAMLLLDFNADCDGLDPAIMRKFANGGIREMRLKSQR